MGGQELRQSRIGKCGVMAVLSDQQMGEKEKQEVLRLSEK